MKVFVEICTMYKTYKVQLFKMFLIAIAIMGINIIAPILN